MDVTMTWANRKHDRETPELVCAWDEYCIDANYDGWVEDKKRALDSLGDDLLNHVDVVVCLPYEEVLERLNPKPIRMTAKIADG